MKSTVNETVLIDSRAAGQMLGVSERTLANWASMGRGPVYVKVGDLRRYSREDLCSFIENCPRGGGGIGRAITAPERTSV